MYIYIYTIRFSGDLEGGHFKAYLSDGELITEVPFNSSSNHVKAKKMKSRSIRFFILKQFRFRRIYRLFF